MAVYRPRCFVRLFVPNVGTPAARSQQEQLDSVTELVCRCYRVRLESNDHNAADECELHLAYDDAGIDPRFLRSAEVYVYLADGTSRGDFTPSADTLRFVGIACEVERILSESHGKVIRIRALDYTTLFINARNYPPSGVPEFSDSLVQAWRRVCDNTGYYDLASKSIVSTVQRLRDRIEFTSPGLQNLTIGSAVGKRLAQFGKLQVPHGADAWAVWQTAVGSLGLISFIRGDRCIVTTATDYYTADNPPLFVWGLNVREITETRDVNALSSKNVGVENYDPILRKTVEAFWPPLEQAVRTKKLGASALGPGVVARASDYEIYDSPFPTTDPDVLQAVARRIWEERSRQELQGRLITSEMYADTLAGAQSFDLLALQAGDRIRVDIDRESLSQIQRLPSLQARQQELARRGYSPDMTRFIIENLDAITKLPAEFQVHSVETSLDTSSTEGGRYEMVIKYVNRIDLSGSSQTSPSPAKAPVPITNQKELVTNPDDQRRRDGTNLNQKTRSGKRY